MKLAVRPHSTAILPAEPATRGNHPQVAVQPKPTQSFNVPLLTLPVLSQPVSANPISPGTRATSSRVSQQASAPKLVSREPVRLLPIPSESATDLFSDDSDVVGDEATDETADEEVAKLAKRVPSRTRVRGYVSGTRSGGTIIDQSTPSKTTDRQEQQRAVAAAKLAETKATKRVSELQLQLEAEEKSLETKLSRYAKQRNAALESGEEALLKRIEAAEQAAVSSYERRVQTLLTTSSASKSNAASASPIKNKQAISDREVAATKSKAQPKVTASKERRPSDSISKSAKSAGPAWLRQLTGKSAAATKRPAATTKVVTTKSQKKYRLVDPKTLRAAKSTEGQSGKVQAKSSQPAKPERKSTNAKPRKRLNLWPFRKSS